jgi:hypothetical protein
LRCPQEIPPADGHQRVKKRNVRTTKPAAHWEKI